MRVHHRKVTLAIIEVRKVERETAGIYILAIPHPLGRGKFLSKLKLKNLKEDFMKKRKGKGGKRRKRKRVIKHTLNTFMELK